MCFQKRNHPANLVAVVVPLEMTDVSAGDILELNIAEVNDEHPREPTPVRLDPSRGSHRSAPRRLIQDPSSLSSRVVDSRPSTPPMPPRGVPMASVEARWAQLAEEQARDRRQNQQLTQTKNEQNGESIETNRKSAMNLLKGLSDSTRLIHRAPPRVLPAAEGTPMYKADNEPTDSESSESAGRER